MTKSTKVAHRPAAVDSKTEKMTRAAVLNRDTNETKVQVALSLDGGALPTTTKPDPLVNGNDSHHASQATSSQTIDVNTGIGFLDHVSH